MLYKRNFSIILTIFYELKDMGAYINDVTRKLENFPTPTHRQERLTCNVVGTVKWGIGKIIYVTLVSERSHSKSVTLFVNVPYAVY